MSVLRLKAGVVLRLEAEVVTAEVPVSVLRLEAGLVPELDLDREAG